MEQYRRLLSVDPSLRCSGWALFEVAEERLEALGKVREENSQLDIWERMSSLQRKIARLLAHLEIGEGDVVIVEAATTMRDPKAVLLLEQVRTIFETLARERGARVPGRIHPRTVQHEVLGLRGRQELRDVVKASARGAVKHLFEAQLKRLGIDCDESSLTRHQDMVDALLIGSLALQRLRSAEQLGAGVEALFAEQGRRRRA